MGSRVVPHRLNAEERKAFELGKKRGYVVQQANTRRYPLINTYRNYCDALGFPCIRIEQGPSGSTNEVVIDLTPLRLSEGDSRILRNEITKAITLITPTDDEMMSSHLFTKEDGNFVQISDQDDFSLTNLQDESMGTIRSNVDQQESIMSDDLERSHEILRIPASNRNMTKLIGQAALDTWRIMSRSKANKFKA